MVTLGRKANTKSAYRRMDRQLDSSNPPPPQLVAGGYNYDKRLPSHSKYSFTFTLISIALKKMLFKCFTYKHYVPSLPPPLPWGQNPYPGDHQIHNFGKGIPALHHYAFGFSQTCAVVKKKIFENWSLLGSFCPTPKAPGVQETWNLQFMCPLPQICFIPNLKRIGQVVIKKKLKMFNW